MEASCHDLAVAIMDGSLLQQRKARLITLSLIHTEGAAAPGLSFAEGLTMLTIGTAGNMNIGELSQVLRLERSWVSRLISGLEERELVRTYAPPEDKRSRKIVLTKKGEGSLQALYRLRAAVIEQTFAELNEDEKSELRDLLQALADASDAPALTAGESHPIDTQIARLSFAHGVAGENFLGSGFNVSRYQILFELVRRSPDFVSASDLSYAFPVDLSTVFRTLVHFCDLGLAERRTSREDARKQLVRISTKGKAAWRRLRTTALDMYLQPVEQMGEKKAARLAALLAKATAEIPGRHRSASARSVEVRTIRNDEGLVFFGGADLVKDSETLKRSFGLFEQGELKGVVLSVTRQDQENPSLLLKAERTEPVHILRLLKTAMRIGPG